MRINTLSGRFLLLTALFVVLAQVLILMPSVARFQHDWLMLRLEKAQIAALTLLASDGPVPPGLEAELLENADVFNVVLRRDALRQLVLSGPLPGPVAQSVDLRAPSIAGLLGQAADTLRGRADPVIRVIGAPSHDAGLLIEITTATAPLRAAMWDHALRLLVQSAALSMATAMLLVLAVQRLMLRPIARLVAHMKAYAEDPEDARRIVTPGRGVAELREAEAALNALQTQLTAALRQKDRLAQLGTAVAKISHDLRNLLTTSQLFADRIEASADPGVARAAPKLVASISRAVSLCEATLAFGRAEEPPPRLTRLALRPLVEDLIEGEGLTGSEGPVRALIDIAPGLTLRADPEQLYRVLSNLVRNARQAIEQTGAPGTIELSAGEDDAAWWLRVGDDGPGLPPKARENLFSAFAGGTRRGGSGLGLAIAQELVRGHGGRLTLERSDSDGTTFMVTLPKSVGG